MIEGAIQLKHNGQTYHGRWELDNSDVLSVWTGDVGPFTTINGPGRMPPERMARLMLREYLNGAGGDRAIAQRR